MKIHQFSQQGKRSNNEDSLGTNEVILTVCDGMGGHNYGERASSFVIEHMLQAFNLLQPLGKTEIQQQLSKVQHDINVLLDKEPELEKMGTTFTGVFRTPDVWYAAHIGDSRIYLFRPSERKLWHTWDHSLVGDLMRTHEITTEAGRFHPMSNRISKAIIAQKDRKPSMASISKIDELKANDIILLCSDGVIEAFGDHDLVQLFSNKSLTFEQKCKKLAAQCNENSKDNNTAIIAEIETCDAFSYGSNEELDWITFDEVEADYKQYLVDSGDLVEEATTELGAEEGEAIHEHKHHKRRLWPLITFVILALAAVSIYFFFKKPAKKDTRAYTKKDKTEQVENNLKDRLNSPSKATQTKTTKKETNASKKEK